MASREDYVLLAEQALKRAHNLAFGDGAPDAARAAVAANIGRGWALLAGLAAPAAGVANEPARQAARGRAGGGRGSRGAARDAGPEPEVSREGGRWEINCPEHGWHGAVEFDADGDMPAVVKCSAKSGTGHCRVKLPLRAALAQIEVD